MRLIIRSIENEKSEYPFWGSVTFCIDPFFSFMSYPFSIDLHVVHNK
jgi:hypothetical protein